MPVSAQNNAIDLFAKPAASGISSSSSNSNNQSAPATTQVVSTDQVRAELLAWAPDGVAPGKQVWLGLQLTHQPDWHTYWKNSGDSGLPTTLEWQLPAGITAGAIAWPTPTKIPLGNLANYGYEKTVLLPVPITVAPDFKGDELEVKLSAQWLACRQECIPQEGEFSLRMPVKSSSAVHAEVFQAAFNATPKPLPTGASQAQVQGQTMQLTLAGLPAALRGQTLAFFPELESIIEPAGAWQQAWQGDVWTAQLTLAEHRSESPAQLPLVVSGPGGAYQLSVPVQGPWPSAPEGAAPVSAALQAALDRNAALADAPAQPATDTSGGTAWGLWAALLSALVGGMILNLMPCVFPVLAIKVVGFVHVKDQATRVRTGLAYTAGVVLSFMALGALLLALRAAGEQLGWGFQLQSPAVVAALAALFTLLGLNLAGVFEFGSLLPSRIASLQAKNPTIDAFLSGVLATAIASPCTAPFMGASLGYAIGLPAWQALAVFATLGIGMALPYVVASVSPAVARRMPRPGAWMVTFKQLMAFPMFATVVWLVWVLGQQSGINGAAALLVLLVMMALALWAFSLQGKARWVLGAIALALGALALAAFGPTVTDTPEPTTASATSNSNERWQPWSAERVQTLNAQGQTVFVDFTAAWCVTCQYNKKTTLNNAGVLADFDAKNVALLRADWTRRDPLITSAINALGRSGVPLYVIYQPGKAPRLLSEILSTEAVHAELARL